jgi:hypothetical protein
MYLGLATRRRAGGALGQGAGHGTGLHHWLPGGAALPSGPGAWAGEQCARHPALCRVWRGADAVPGRAGAAAQRLWSLRRPIFGWGSAQVLGCAAGAVCGVGWRWACPGAIAWWRRWGWRCRPRRLRCRCWQSATCCAPAAGRRAFQSCCSRTWRPSPSWRCCPCWAPGRGGSNPALRQRQVLEAIKIIGVIGAIVLGGRLLLRPAAALDRQEQNAGGLHRRRAAAGGGHCDADAVVGLSMALGAFLAGVLLADSEYRRELEPTSSPSRACCWACSSSPWA